jgi:hypothetical protein
MNKEINKNNQQGMEAIIYISGNECKEYAYSTLIFSQDK